MNATKLNSFSMSSISISELRMRSALCFILSEILVSISFRSFKLTVKNFPRFSSSSKMCWCFDQFGVYACGKTTHFLSCANLNFSTTFDLEVTRMSHLIGNFRNSFHSTR